MLQWKVKKDKIIYIGLCLFALVGFVFPAINIDISFFGSSTSTSVNAFSIVSFFSNSDARFGGMDLTKTDIFGLSDSGGILAGAGVKLIISVAVYYITIILLIIILICKFAGKLKKSSNIMLGVSFILYAYAGYIISTLTELLFGGLENALGFLASFIDISDMIRVSLGIGYWLTLAAIGCLLVIKIIIYVLYSYSKHRKKGGGLLDN